jgi:hypothetical protein
MPALTDRRLPADQELDELDLPSLGDESEEDPPAGFEESELDVDDEAHELDDAASSDLDVGADDLVEDDETVEDDSNVRATEEGLVDDVLSDAESALGDALDGIADSPADAIDEWPDEVDDGGVEGTDEAIEDEVDEAFLPDLDADAEGDADDAVAAGILSDFWAPPLDAAPWSQREGAGASVPVRRVAVGQGRVAAAGEALLLVDEGAHSASASNFDGGAQAVAFIESGLFVAGARGEIRLVGRDGAHRKVLALAPGPIALAAGHDRAWALHDRSLWSLVGTPSQIREDDVVAVAASGAGLVALTRLDDAVSIERLRGDDEAWQVLRLEGAGASFARGETACLASAGDGRLIAIADAVRGLALSRDGGESFREIEVTNVVALSFAGEAIDAVLVAAIQRESDGAIALVRCPDEDPPTTLALLDAPSAFDAPNSSPVALAWDSVRDVMWVACALGLVAVGPSRSH